MARMTDLPVGTYVTQKGYRLIAKLLASKISWNLPELRWEPGNFKME